MWLEVQFKKPISNEAIFAQLQKTQKWAAKFPLKDLDEYRESIVPGYKTILLKSGPPRPQEPLVENIEERVEEEIAEADIKEEVFSRDEKKKLNMLKSHRRMLSETWELYQNVKPGEDERAKKDYLSLMESILEKIEKSELAEEDFFSAIEECRKAEAAMTIDKHYDSMISWGIPRMAEKGKSQHEILEYLFRLQLFLNYYSKVIMTHAKIEDANKQVLEDLYADKEAIEPK